MSCAGAVHCSDTVHDHLDLLPEFITFDYF